MKRQWNTNNDFTLYEAGENMKKDDNEKYRSEFESRARAMLWNGLKTTYYIEHAPHLKSKDTAELFDMFVAYKKKRKEEPEQVEIEDED